MKKSFRNWDLGFNRRSIPLRNIILRRRRVLCTVHCALCTVHCVLCTAHCVLCTVYCVLCTVYCVLCTVHCVLCTVYCALWTVHCALCTVNRKMIRREIVSSVKNWKKFVFYSTWFCFLERNQANPTSSASSPNAPTATPTTPPSIERPTIRRSDWTNASTNWPSLTCPPPPSSPLDVPTPPPQQPAPLKSPFPCPSRTGRVSGTQRTRTFSFSTWPVTTLSVSFDDYTTNWKDQMVTAMPMAVEGAVTRRVVRTFPWWWWAISTTCCSPREDICRGATWTWWMWSGSSGSGTISTRPPSTTGRSSRRSRPWPNWWTRSITRAAGAEVQARRDLPGWSAHGPNGCGPGCCAGIAALFVDCVDELEQTVDD